MPTYLREIEYAATSTIQSIWTERDALSLLEHQAEKLRKEVEAEYDRSQSIAMNAEDADDVMLATGMHWENYFGPDKDHHALSIRQVELTNTINVRLFSTNAQAATLLQYGKQGISIVHRGLSGSPGGRAVGTQLLKDVVWQGRNHALHWEAGNPHQPVQQCFNTLAQDFGTRFADYRTHNLAFAVVEVLRWRAFDDFRNDMLLLS